MRDTSAAIAPMASLGLCLAVVAAALAIDIGSYTSHRRSLQGVADLAAMAAAETLSPSQTRAAATATATRAVTTLLAANGYPATAVATVTLGTYGSDANIAAERRFGAATGGRVDAVRVELAEEMSLVFGRLIGDADPSIPPGTVRIRVRSTAAAARFAAIEIGSQVAGLDGGVLDLLLGTLLGGDVSLSLLDYRALASTRIDLFAFSKALATRVGLTAVTYDGLLSTRIGLGDLLEAAAEVARSGSGSASRAVIALRALAVVAAGAGATVDLSRLLSFGPWGSRTVDGTAEIGAEVDLFGLLTAVLQVSDGRHFVDTAIGVALAPLATVRVQLAIGERPVNSPWVAIGARDVRVHTAQVRLLVIAQIGAAPLPQLRLPIYVEIGAAEATLSRVTCEPTTATVAARPGVIDAWIADVSDAEFRDTTTSPHPSAARLVEIPPFGRIDVLAHVAIADLRATDLLFRAADIGSATPLTVSTRNLLASLIETLLGSLSISVNGVPVVAGVWLAPLTGVLVAAVTPLDALLVSLTRLLGVSLGRADVWVTGVRCDGAVLID
jgi:uncharacterized membrane protein